MRNSDYGSLGELHPQYAKDHGSVPPLYEERRAARAAVPVAPEPTDKWGERRKAARKLAEYAWKMHDEKVRTGEWTRERWYRWCLSLHDSAGRPLDLCFSCRAPWHPWSVNAEGLPECGFLGGEVTEEQYLGLEEAA